jgi:hypothetical protein
VFPPVGDFSRNLGHADQPLDDDLLVTLAEELLDLDREYLQILHLLVEELDKPPELSWNDISDEDGSYLTLPARRFSSTFFWTGG